MDISNKSVLSLIKLSAVSLKGKWIKALIGTIAYLAPMVALCLIPYVGWAAAVLLFGFLTVNYIKYFNDLFSGGNVKLYTIFAPNRNLSTVTFLGVLIVMLILTGSILFIIPGLIIIAFYSMSMFVIEEENSTSVLETMRSCAKKMEGNKVALLSYKVLYYIGYALIALIFSILYMLLSTMVASYPFLSIMLLILLGLIAFFAAAIVTMYLHATNVMFYKEVLKEKNVTVSAQEESAKPEEKESEDIVIVVEEEKVSKEQPAKEAAAKPKTTKKPTTKK